MIDQKYNQNNPKVEIILDSAPEVLNSYYLFSLKKNKQQSSLFRRIIEINKFLEFLTKQFEYKSTKDVSIKDLETLDIALIEKYLRDKYGYKYNSLGFILYSLQHFWNYLSNYSYTIEQGKPIFYRNAINEWKIAYEGTYLTIKKYFSKGNKNSNQPENLFSKNDFIEILDFYDKSYILSLDTELKAKNFEKNREKYIAATALLMATGITVEMITNVNLSDIDLKRKSLIISKEEQDKEIITIDDYLIPYIKPYLAKRRAWWVADVQQPALFLNQNKKRVKQSFFTTILLKLSTAYKEEISATKIRLSYQEIHK